MHLKIRDSLLFSTRNQEKHKLRNKLHNIKFNIENVNKNSKIFGLLSKENYSQISGILKEMSLCKTTSLCTSDQKCYLEKSILVRDKQEEITTIIIHVVNEIEKQVLTARIKIENIIFRKSGFSVVFLPLFLYCRQFKKD